MFRSRMLNFFIFALGVSLMFTMFSKSPTGAVMRVKAFLGGSDLKVYDLKCLENTGDGMDFVFYVAGEVENDSKNYLEEMTITPILIDPAGRVLQPVPKERDGRVRLRPLAPGEEVPFETKGVMAPAAVACGVVFRKKGGDMVAHQVDGSYYVLPNSTFAGRNALEGINALR